MPKEKNLDDLDAAFGDENDDLDLDEAGDDNELDSFFEDLSSIEDLDSPDSDEAVVEDLAAEVTPTPQSETAPVTPSPVEPQAQEEPGKKKNKFLKIFSFLIASVIIGVMGWVVYFVMNKVEEPIPEIDPKVDAQNTSFIETPGQNVEDIQPDIEPPPKGAGQVTEQQTKPIEVKETLPPPKPKPFIPKYTKNGRYIIQVASCNFVKCIEEFETRLRRRNLRVYKKSILKQYNFIELISGQVFDSGTAEEYIKIINQENELAGFASIVKKSNGYKISLGEFPHLERAKEVKSHIENIFPNKQVIFDLEHVQKNFGTTKIFAGPYKTKRGANIVMRRLHRYNFGGAFVANHYTVFY